MTRPSARLDHARGEVVDHVEGSVQIDVHTHPPAFRGVLESGFGRRQGRVVDEQVAAVPVGVDALGELCDGLLVPDVESQGQDPLPLLAHQVCGLFDGAGELPGTILRRARGADDVVASAGEVDAEALADTAAGAGDEGNGGGHGILLPRC